jgi:hypothetical protein
MHVHVYVPTCTCTTNLYIHDVQGVTAESGNHDRLWLLRKIKKSQAKRLLRFLNNQNLSWLGDSGLARLWRIAFRIVHVHACTCACRHMHVLVHAYVSTVLLCTCTCACAVHVRSCKLPKASFRQESFYQNLAEKRKIKQTNKFFVSI